MKLKLLDCPPIRFLIGDIKPTLKSKLKLVVFSIFAISQSHAQCPNASFTSTAPACSTTDVSFTNTSGNTGAGWTYFWDFDYPNGGGSAPATSTNQNPTGINYSGGGNGVYTVAFTITNAGLGCTSTILMDIDIRRVRADFISSANNLCIGDSVLFYNNGTPGSSPTATVTHAWSFGAGSSPSTSSAINPPAVTYSSAGAKTVTHTVQVNYGGCGGVRTDVFTQNITVNPTPSISFASDAPACEGELVSFNYTGTAANQVTWDFGANASPQTSLGQNPTGIAYAAPGVKTIAISAVNSYGCTEYASGTITINGLPAVNAGADTTICANTSVPLGSTATAGNSYSWFPPSTLDNSSISNPIASPVGSVTNYIVTMTDNATGCSATDSVVVTMMDPLVANAGTDGEICFGDSFQLGTGMVEGQTYSWSSAADLNSATAPNPVATPDSTTTYVLTVNGYGCGPETDEVTVIVHPLPLANAGVDDSITVGSNTQLIATGGVQYSWSPSNGLSNIGIFDPVAGPDSTTTYIVTVTDIYGCVQTDTMTVVVIEPSFWVPTGFSPNADGYNDVFYVRGEGITDFEFVVFNKLGEPIFRTQNLNTGWNGRKQISDEEMPIGAYVYHISGVLSDGQPVDVDGVVNLIR